MMVDGAEECQLRGPIDVLAPYSSDEIFGTHTFDLAGARCSSSSTSWAEILEGLSGCLVLGGGRVAGTGVIRRRLRRS